jgi:hypothetical protein
MEIFYRQQISLTGYDPPFFINGPAFGTMPVSATVIVDMDLSAFLTCLNMTTHVFGAAMPQGM